jgi:hypothetical protein
MCSSLRPSRAAVGPLFHRSGIVRTRRCARYAWRDYVFRAGCDRCAWLRSWTRSGSWLRRYTARCKRYLGQPGHRLPWPASWLSFKVLGLPASAVPSSRLRITLRSTGPSTASQLGPASASGLSCAGRAKLPHRCGPVSSNVMRCPSVLRVAQRNQPGPATPTPCRTRPSAQEAGFASVAQCSLWAARSPLWHRPHAPACSLRVAVGAQSLRPAGLRRGPLVAPGYFASPTTAATQLAPWPFGPPPFLACRLALVQRA